MAGSKEESHNTLHFIPLQMLRNISTFFFVESFRHTTSKLDAAAAETRRLGIFRSNELVKAGYSREYIKRLVHRGDIRQTARGFYESVTFEGDHNQSLLEATKRFPRSVVCLVSALQIHEIGTQAPYQMWLAIPRDYRYPKMDTTSSIRFCRFSTTSYSFGMIHHQVSGGTIPVYTAAKTIADCFKYRNRIGLDVAIEALRNGWMDHKFSLAEIRESAKICRVANVIQPYLEMLA